jgi:hypothetical protein
MRRNIARDDCSSTVVSSNRATGKKRRFCNVVNATTVPAVSAVPPDYRWAKDFTIIVESKGWRDGQEWWAVKNVGYYLATDGSWSPYEPADRWDLETALKLAREQAPKLTYGTWTVADALAQYAEGQP